MDFKSEDRIQSDCYIWFHNTYPKLRGLLCYNLNNSKNKIAGARNKAMGLQPGRSDFVLYYKGSAYMIEMKTETGTQLTAQKKWQTKMLLQGFDYYICRNIEEFKTLINIILANNELTKIMDI